MFKRRRPQPRTLEDLTTLEAVQLVVDINDALERGDYFNAFKMLGIDDKVAASASSLDEIWIEDEQLHDLLKILPHIKVTGSGPQRLGRVDCQVKVPDSRALRGKGLDHGRANPGRAAGDEDLAAG